MEPDSSLTSRARTTHAQTIETLEHSIDVIRATIAVNRDLARLPEHEASGQQRIIDGEIEIATLEAELAALRRGDVEGALDVHEEFPAPPPR